MEEFKILIISAFIIILGIFLNKIFIKKNYLLNYNGSDHQKFTKSKSVPLTGGILLFMTLIFFDLEINDYFIYFLSIIFLWGFLGDAGFIKSPKIRFFLQLLTLFIYVYLTSTTISNIRFEPLDTLLQLKFFNYFFIVVCLMILINGTNFIDGCNTLVIGYYLVISIILFKLGFFDIIFIGQKQVLILLAIFLSLFVLNFFEKLFLGDAGVYIFSFIFGVLLIKIYHHNSIISPYFICNLLWYPAFEVLFSIIRKVNFDYSILKPDTKHFHQLLYFYISKKYKKLDNIILNNLTANLINLYNFIILLVASDYLYNSKTQIFILVVNIIIYCLLYLRFYNFRFNNNF